MSQIKLNQEDFRDFVFCKNFYYYKCLYPGLDVRARIKNNLLAHLAAFSLCFMRKITDNDFFNMIKNFHPIHMKDYMPPIYRNANTDSQKWLYYILQKYADGFTKEFIVGKHADLNHDALIGTGINPTLDFCQDIIITRPKELHYITLITDPATRPELRFIIKPSNIFKIYYQEDYKNLKHRNVLFNLLTNTIYKRNFYDRTTHYLAEQLKKTALQIEGFKIPIPMGIMQKCYMQCPYIGYCKPGGSLDKIEIKKDGQIVFVIKDGKVYQIINGKEVLIDDQPKDIISD